MPTVDFDVYWHRNEKFNAFHGVDRARVMALHAAAITHCGLHLTDGFITEATLITLISNGETTQSERETWKRLIAKMAHENIRLLDPAPDGYRVHNFLVYQPSRETAKQRSDRARERGMKGIEARYADRPPFDYDATVESWPTCMEMRTWSQTGKDEEMCERTLRGHILKTASDEIGEKWAHSPRNVVLLGKWITEGCDTVCDGKRCMRCADSIRDHIEKLARQAASAGEAPPIGLIKYRIEEGARG